MQRKIEEHDLGNENRQEGPKEVQFGTVGDRKSDFDRKREIPHSQVSAQKASGQRKAVQRADFGPI